MQISSRQFVFLALAAVAAGVAMVGLEIVVEAETVGVLEFFIDSIEKSLMVVGAGGVLLLALRARTEHREKIALITELDRARRDGAQWRGQVQAHVAGLGAEIARQFRTWGLTEAESAVGMTVLKGLSHKEIAVLRGTSEATVRQQARSIYQKSGLSGKAAFSAYFLEDLLPPPAASDSSLEPPDQRRTH